MKQLVSTENINTYKAISEKLVSNKVVTKENPRTVIKALKFLSQPQWFDCSTACNNMFMHLLRGSIFQLNSRELLSLFKVLLYFKF